MKRATGRPATSTLIALGAVVLAAGWAACSKNNPEPTQEGPAHAAPSAMGEASKAKEGAPVAAGPSGVAPAGGPTVAQNAAVGPEIGYEPPASWTSVPNANTMRKATYKIGKAAGDSEDAEMTVSVAAGGVEPNVKRWAGQFGNAEPKTEKRKVGGLDVTVVEIKGTFSGGMGMAGGSVAPKEKSMLLGAVVDTGERQTFFKMTGPEKTVTAAKPDFEKLVSSLRTK